MLASRLRALGVSWASVEAASGVESYMLSLYRLEVALAISGITTALLGLGVTVLALLLRSTGSRALAINLLLFSLVCLALHSSFHC